MENVLLIITNPHQGRKENALLIREARSILQKKQKNDLRIPLSNLYFFLSVLLLVVMLCVWTQMRHLIQLSNTVSKLFVFVRDPKLLIHCCAIYITLGGEIWLSTQGLLCLLGWLFGLNNQYHWDKLNAAFDKGSKHKKNKYIIFFENVLNHRNSGLTFLQKKTRSYVTAKHAQLSPTQNYFSKTIGNQNNIYFSHI